jgi:hypothetical protein
MRPVKPDESPRNSLAVGHWLPQESGYEPTRSDRCQAVPQLTLSKLAREGCFDYFLVESPGISELLSVAEPRLGRRTVLTFPLLPPPQKN